MAVVDLTGIPIREASPTLMDFGGLIRPETGGQLLRVDRLGTRWSWQFQTAPMPIEPDGRRWAAQLLLARRLGAKIAIPQPGLNRGGPGAPTVDADTAAGRAAPITGATANYAVKMGQWVTLVTGGRGYLDMVAAQCLLDAAGEGTLAIQNLLRAPLDEGDSVEIARPWIEGEIEGDFTLPLASSRLTSFAFAILETA